MCYAFVLGGFGPHYETADTKHVDTVVHPISIDMSLTQPMQTSGSPLRAQDADVRVPSKMSPKRHAPSPAHDDEPPAKIAKTTASFAEGELHVLAGEKEESGGCTVLDAKETDDASVVDLGVGSVRGGSDGGGTAELGGQDKAGAVETAVSVSSGPEIDRLKQRLADQDGELKEANARIERLKQAGRSVRDQFEDTSAKLERTELELEKAREEASDMRAENIILRNEQQQPSATSEVKSGTTRATLKEQFKDVEKKCNERWAQKMKKASDDNAARITKLRNEHRQHVEKKESAWRDKLDELKKKHERQEKATKEACEDKKTEWKTKFNKLVAEARADKDKAIESEKQAKKKFAEDMKASKAEQQAEIKKYKPETADAVKALNAKLAESNAKVEQLRVKVVMQDDLAARALEDTRNQKSSLGIATDLVEKARAEKEDLKEKLAEKVAEVAEWKDQTRRAFQDVAFHKQKAAEWKMRAEAHQRGVHALNLALEGRDKALDRMRAELRAALSENERLRGEEKRLVGELAGSMDEGCA